MEKRELGLLMQRLRKQKGITQEKLAMYSGVDQSTIARIENGKTMPRKDTFRMLFEKIGYDPSNLVEYFLSKGETKQQKIINELDVLIVQKMPNEAEVLLCELESDGQFMQDDLNKQYILFVKAAICMNREKDMDRAFALLNESIKLTIPVFYEHEITDYFLSNRDIKIINMMATIYSYQGQINRAIEIMYALKENFDKYCVDRNQMGKHYPFIVYNLTQKLGIAGRHKEVIELCDVGIKICKDTGYLHSLPQLSINKACGLCELGRSQEGEQLFRDIYYGCRLLERFDAAENAKNYAKEKYGIVL